MYLWIWCLWFVLCSDKLSFHFLAPVFSLLNVFQHTEEFSFSGLFCNRLYLNVYSNPPLTYVSYLFFLNCCHFASKYMKNFYSKKRLNCFGRTSWKLNKKISMEYPLLHYVAENLSYQSIIYYHSLNPNRIQIPYGNAISQF